MSEANKAVIHRFVQEVQNQHDLDAIDELFSPSFVNHDTMPGFANTLQGAKDVHKMFFAAFPDLKMTIDDQAAEGNKVWSLKTATATHNGPFLGIPATGKKIAWRMIDIFSVVDGKITEHWVVGDNLGLMQQLGVVPG